MIENIDQGSFFQELYYDKYNYGIDKFIGMRKLIAITDEIVKSLKIMAVNKDCDLKNYIQDVLINHVKKIIYL